MSLRQIIRRSKLIKQNLLGKDVPFVIPGEPLVYSLKCQPGKRQLNTNYFRKKQWQGMLRCQLPAYIHHKALILIVRFYLTPPERVKLTKGELKREKTPALWCHEICEYLLDFLEMLKDVLFHSYRQFIKIDAEKIYSANPRTEFKFLTHEEYVKYQANDTANTEGKSECTPGETRLVQSERQGNDINPRECAKVFASRLPDAVNVGTITSDCALPDTPSKIRRQRKTPSAKLLTPLEASRRRQSREVSERCAERSTVGGRCTDIMATEVEVLEPGITGENDSLCEGIANAEDNIRRHNN